MLPMNTNLYALMQSRFPAERSRPCLLLPDGRDVSYAALVQGVSRAAALLRAKGVKPGDRIAAQVEKSVGALMLYLATLQVGAIYAPLNTAYTDGEIGYFVGDLEPKLIIRDIRPFAGESHRYEPDGAIDQRHADDIAAIIYTSGTTGRSKGAMLSHGNLAANAEALIQTWGYTSNDVLLHALPIFHVHGLFISLHCALLTGSPIIWLPKFDDGEVIAALPRATVMMGVPTFYTRLLANPAFTRDAARHVRVFISGSAPLLESTFAEFEQRTGQRILERYGMSEAVIITSNPLKGDRIAGSVGFPLTGVDLRIGGGEIGEIEIKGPSVFGGYWRMPDREGDFSSDGYFRTGDVGRQDADGRVWITGRAKDLIISRGFNVYPKEIELVLDTLPGVVETAVIGAPHHDFGEAVVAVVIGEGEEGAIIAAARERLAPFKAPKRVVFVKELPRNAMGKVQKAVLRETYKDIFTR
jgi:malonyl-CoA/methylmalonyl-CoA synthetase